MRISASSRHTSRNAGWSTGAKKHATKVNINKRFQGMVRSGQGSMSRVFRTYDREWRTNEHELLRGLNKHGLDGCDARRVGVEEIRETRAFDVYEVQRDC